MSENIKLAKGKNYIYTALNCVGWSNGQADYGGIYHGEYFDSVYEASAGIGCYQGPDADGVEPLYASETTADLIDSNTTEVIRKATVGEMEDSLNCGQAEGCIDVDGRRCYVAD